MIEKLKSSLVRSYYFLKYKKARELKRKGIPFDHYRELNKTWLVNRGIKTILDVGANRGQFAKLSREVFPTAQIYSFEPLPECYEDLCNALHDDPNFKAFNKGLGRSVSTIEFYRSIHTPSSSFLEMEELHKDAFPESKKGQEQQAIRVPVDTLDNFYHAEHPESPILVKIDVQGFEGEVIAGGSELLKQAAVVILEMSLVKLYKDQPLFHDVYEEMYRLGFRYHGNLAQMLHVRTQEVVQIDAIFIKEE